MGSASLAGFFTALLEPKPAIIFLTLVVAIGLPLLLHILLYRSSTKTTLPTFLLIGSTGSGKTSLMLQLEGGYNHKTYTSQAPSTVELSLPLDTKAASSQYRSLNDPSLQVHKRLLLVDTPGHGKLRHYATTELVRPQNLRGIIFVVDAADLSPDSQGLRDTAEYLHDLLLLLQKRLTSNKTSKAPSDVPVLIAANKTDLFTALPAVLVKKTLEAEITGVRTSRAKGLLDSGIGMNDLADDPDRDWLGEPGEGGFEFSQMLEANVRIQIESGSTSGTENADVASYWAWLGSNL